MSKSATMRIVWVLGTSALAVFALLSVTHLSQANSLAPLLPVNEADGRIGTCYASTTDIDAPWAYQAGARWDRFDFKWHVIETTAGDFNIRGHEQVVSRTLIHNLNVIGILGATPEWAAACPTTTVGFLSPAPFNTISPRWLAWGHACPPQNLDLPWDHPDNVWSAHVQAVVSHFKDDVHVWEIWNEPDATWFWKGTPAQYAQLLKVGYRAVKAADPHATVLFGGLAYWENPGFYIDVLEALAVDPEGAAHNAYFDVMSLHLYANVEQAHDIAAQVSAEVARHVGPHPLWLTEAGVKVWPEDEPCPPDAPECPPYYSAEEDEVAAYMIEAFANARAAGVERFLIFRLRDDDVGMPLQWYGLLKADYTPRPSYVATQVVARYLRDENQVTGPFGEIIRRVTFWGTPHGRVDVLWNRTPTTVTYSHPAVLPTATVVDRLGVTRTLTATDGGFSLTLAPATADRHPAGILMIGGPPALLLQTDTVSPTSALDPLPSSAPSNPLTVTWTATDTGAGYWYAEIAHAPAPTGPWTLAASLSETQGMTQTQLMLPGNGLWYLRGRARDRVGNWEPWPPGSEISTTLNLSSTLALSVTVFSDINRNGMQDSSEPPVDDTTLALRAAAGQVITQVIDSRWQFTRTLPIDSYALTVRQADHEPVTHTVEALTAPGTLTMTARIGLRRTLSHHVYLPLTLRE